MSRQLIKISHRSMLSWFKPRPFGVRNIKYALLEDVQTLKRLTATGTWDYDELLFCSVVMGNADTIAFLSDKCDTTSINKALKEAIFWNAYSAFKILSEKDAHAPNKILNYAIYYDRVDMIRLLLEKGAKPTAADLQSAMRYCSAPTINLLMDHDATFNADKQ